MKLQSGDQQLSNEFDGCNKKSVKSRKKNISKAICKFLSVRYRRKQDEDDELKKVTLVGLFRYATVKDKFMLILGILCGIIPGVLVPVQMYFCGNVDNTLMKISPDDPNFRTNGYKFVYRIIPVGISAFTLCYIAFFCFQTVCSHIVIKLRQEYLKAIVRQNAEWFDKNKCGVLTSRLNDNIDRIREGIGNKLAFLMKGLAMYIASLLFGFVYEWRLALVMCSLSPFTTFLMLKLSQTLDQATEKELENVGNAGAVAEESVLGVRTVQSCNGQETMIRRYNEELGGGKKYGIRKSYWSGSITGFFYFLLFLLLGGGLLYGGHLIKIGIFENPGDLFAVVFACLIGTYLIGAVSPHLMVLLNARAAAATIYSVIDSEPKIDVYSEAGTTLPDLKGRVVFKNVEFSYPSRKNVKVLKGLNLEAEIGKVTALVGHSGCGKSTCISLITRLYEADSGSVTVDGVDVRDLKISWLRNAVGVVQQEPALFNDTIEENLRLGNPNASMDLLIESCKMANAHNFIMKLPKGYQTRIGDGGVQLSGGQKQRIAIARTLARNPKILLLDEATSALDVQSEALVQNALNKASKGRTTIVIAHRLSTIKGADKIVVFDRGDIVEQGTHSELVNANGKYAELVKAQEFQVDESTEEKSIQECLENEANEPLDGPMPDARLIRGRTSESFRGSYAFAKANRESYRASRNSTTWSIVSDDCAVNADSCLESLNDESKATNGGLLTVYKNAQGNYIKIICGLLCGIIFGCHLPTNSLVFGIVFDAFSAKVYDDQLFYELLKALGLYLLTGLVVMAVEFGGTVFFGIVSETIILKLRVQGLRSILHQDGSYFDMPDHSPGKLITHLASDAPKIKPAIDSRVFQITFGLTGMLLSFLLGFIRCWQIALCGTGFILLFGLVQTILATYIKKANKKLAKNDESGKLSVEIIENVRTIQLLTREQVFNDRYTDTLEEFRKAEAKKTLLEALNFAMSQSFNSFVIICSYSIALHCISTGQVAALNCFNAHVSMILASFCVLLFAPYFPDMVEAHSAAKSVFEIINSRPTTGDHMEGLKPEIHGRLRFRNVSFSYPQRRNRNVMDGIHLEAKPGQTIALVGESGCGKSTAIALIERFYDVNNGNVLFDDLDVKKISLHYLRTRVALVGQEPRLFAGTIRDNICLGLDKPVSIEKINETLEIANAKKFVDSLPQGIDTEVGEKGTQLSGGQKQRIAIARAVIRNPKILLLDEATSALDSEAEKLVQVALDSASEGRTCITIAHRLSSIQKADLILYIENGKVQEAGTHSTLMSQKGKYYELIKKQDLNA